MKEVKIFIDLALENRAYILPALYIFALTTFVGFAIFLSLIKEKSWKIIVPASAITGVFSFIIFLNIFSYFFKGPLGIQTILALYFLIGILLLINSYKSVPKFNVELSINNFIYLVLYVFVTWLVVFISATNIYGGDIVAYWGIGHSFINGNYPVMSPWQPDLLAVHHQGSFLYMAVANFFAKAQYHVVHSMYSAFMILSGLFLLWGWTTKRVKNPFLSLIPSLVLYFSIGAIYIPIPNFIATQLSPERINTLKNLPLFVDAKGRLGGAGNIIDFIYINHRAAALAGSLLLLVLIFSKFKYKFFKSTIIAILSVGIISSDEIFLPFIGFVVIFWFIYELFKGDFKKVLPKFIFAGLIFLICFFLVGSAIRDSMLTPPKELHRFTIVFDDFANRLNSLKGVLLTRPDISYSWYLPNMIVFLSLVLLTLFLVPNLFGALIFLGTLGILIAYLFIEHTYYPSNEGRFMNLLFQFYGFIISYNLVLFFERSKKQAKKSTLTLIVILMLFFPALFTATIDIGRKAIDTEYKNLYGPLPERKVLDHIRSNYPLKRVFFVDGYLRGVSYSHLSLEGIQNYGLFIPVSPAFYKVHTPDWGYEVMDIITTLNPEPMKDLKLDYLYIRNDQIKFYTANRQIEINKYLTPVYEDLEGVLYQVTNDYLENATELSPRISELPELISGKIYIDNAGDIDYSYRGALILALKENQLYTVRGPGFFNYIETTLNYENPSEDIEYDYLILGHETDPVPVCNCDNFEKIWESIAAVVYKVNHEEN